MTKQPEALKLAEEGMRLHSLNAPEYIISAELRRLHEVNTELLEALEKLARLGNGDQLGNSEGNMIARAALAKAQGEKE